MWTGECLASSNLGGADADAARVRALAAYKDFFALWKDADPGLPILKEAKAEYAKLVVMAAIRFRAIVSPLRLEIRKC